MTLHRLFVPVLSLAIASTLVSRADAGFGVVSSNHHTDGQFGPSEWNGPNVVTTFFPVEGNTGGAYLYVDQGLGEQAGNLYLLYDYVNSNNAGFGPANSFFDVFFQVDTDKTDYVAHFAFDGQVTLFEKPTGTVSQENPDGTLNLNSAPWQQDTSSDPDFIKANPIGALGFGTSPNSSDAHVIGEFQLTIDRGPGTGLYSPDPAFWSASVGSNGTAAILDPPITSGIFQLDLNNGTTTVNPVFGPNGGPVLQPQDVVPEPSSLALLGIGVVALFSRRRRRQD